METIETSIERMQASNHSDQSLIAKVKTGDESAATAIYERYAKRILSFVNSQMADQMHAEVQPEDIVQSVFKSIFRGVSSGGYNAPEGGTLWQLMAVVAVHKVRRNASKRHAQVRDSRRTQSIESIEDFEVSDRSTQKEFELAIREATESLKPSEQAVVMLRVQGCSVEEISEKLDRSRRSVERLLQSAREKLAKLLSEDSF